MGDHDRTMAKKAPDATTDDVEAALVGYLATLNESPSQSAVDYVVNTKKQMPLSSSKEVPSVERDVISKGSRKNPFDWKKVFKKSKLSDEEGEDELQFEQKYTVSVRMKDVFPRRPSKKAVHHTRRNCENEDTIEQIKYLFNVRPMWTLFALRECTGLSYLQIRLVVKNYAFYITDGPWAYSWCRFGYDPRYSPDAKAYQTIIVDFRRHWNKYGIQGIELNSDKMDIACAVLETESERSIYSEWSLSSDNSVNGDDHLYISGRAPRNAKMLYALCDITLPAAYALIEEKRTWMPRGRSDDKDGWLLPGALDDIQQAIEEDFYSFAQDVKDTIPQEEGYENEEKTRKDLNGKREKLFDNHLQTYNGEGIQKNAPGADERKGTNRDVETTCPRKNDGCEMSPEDFALLLSLTAGEESSEVGPNGYDGLGGTAYEVCRTLGLNDWEAPGARMPGVASDVCDYKDIEMSRYSLCNGGFDPNSDFVTSLGAQQLENFEPSYDCSLEANEFLTRQEAVSDDASKMCDYVEQQEKFDNVMSSFSLYATPDEYFGGIMADLDRLLDE